MNDELLGRTRRETNSLRASPDTLQLPRGPRGRGGSRSPSPAAHVGNGVFFPQAAGQNSDAFLNADSAMGDVSVEELQRIAKTAADAAAAASAALMAMTAQLSAAQQDNTRLRAIKKADLPNFDAKNIDIWIRRVESAFIRAGVTTTKDRFAFLEAKFPVKLDPRINAFLFGDLDPDPWEDFKAYLTRRYGRTKQQKTVTLIEGIPREGRRPSEMVALLVDLTKDVTVEDIQKEHLLRQLPVDVRRALAKEADTLSLVELAEAADTYFDQQGRPKFAARTSAINNINNAVSGSNQGSRTHTAALPTENSDPTFTAPFPAEQESVNEIRRQPPKPSRPSTGASQQSQRGSSASTSRPHQRQAPARTPTFDKDGACYYHATFGVKADKCQPGCRHPAAQASGNAAGARRK